ncbi:heme-binding protein [Mycolicibacillus parakoreensis]|uniref:Heme-binding protein n=1 Tax=Mycolicibacillus parakoreensis TaxID=1069221 RepID=A0ABY3TZN4_9MYCO|nr:heme-binding protein [Mycolicibacillus parakoreensis]MCV7314500.1 heme-binding protein [Mycolicibacillus parakoreensis]ULN53165.1 heme-binding protein [Mycolicibacillus parakoreensis]HLR98440.1 heme-binding protein [Mycolicibacillus parakoreensis]
MTSTRRTHLPHLAVGVAAIGLAGGIAAAAPAAAAPPCTAGALSSTASGVLNQVAGFFDDHPEANDVVTEAAKQSPADARDSVRGYFTGHPGELLELQGIARPLTDMRNECGVELTPGHLATLIETITE